ncbi:MAG TPA: RNA methyltransferase [Streptosporangiaceae bacterium]|nr:RNA methyltransferase [Streptosporangiaceae bacterium]
MSAARPSAAKPPITSTANPRVKQLVALRRRRVRDDTMVTLVEGYEELELALSAGVRPRSLYYSADLAHQAPDAMIERLAASGTEIIQVSQDVFGKVAYRESPDGWLAVVPAVRADLSHIDLGANPLMVICQGIEKPGNLGAILRTADAAGVAAVIATDPVTDWGNPNVIRASKGTVFSVPVASGDSAEVLAWLAEHEIRIVATTPGADLLLTEADLAGPTAITVGSEKYGLSAQWLANAADKVRIPMFGRADSLNVATSAAIVCYEAVRQRLRTP